MHETDNERWRKTADKEMAQQCAAGDLIEPDMNNPAHKRIMTILSKLSEEFGIDPAVYFAPVRPGVNEESTNRNQQLNLGGFLAHSPNNTIIIPESADYYFTDEEIEAVLAHELDHLLNPEMFGEKMSGLEQFNNAHVEWMRALHQAASPQLCDDLKSKRDALFAKVSELATRFEVSADENAIRTGRASDLISALQKTMICRYIGEDADLLPSQDITQICNDRYELQRAENQVATAGCSKETFLERLKRLEKAAEQEESRSR